MRRSSLLLLFLFSIVHFISAQSIERKVIASAGIYYESPTLSVSSTVGETFVNTLSTPGQMLTQGFQQPYLSIVNCSLTASASASPILCNGGTATVTVSAASGTGAYTGTGSFTAGEGVSTYTVTDGNGCTTTTSLTITAPAALTASATASPIACIGGSTSVTVSATGGTTAYSGTGTFTQGAGSTTYTVIDANNCSSTTIVTLTQPATLVASVASGAIACNGGSALVTVSASGGTGVYAGTGIFSQLAGTTNYTVTDANGCSATISVSLTNPEILLVSAPADIISCNGGSALVTVFAVGGTPPFNGTGIFNQISGTTNYTVIDANGCSATTSVMSTQSDLWIPTVEAESIHCFGGTASVLISISSMGGASEYSGTGIFTQSVGTTTYTVTDANGCSATTSVTLTEPTALEAWATAGLIPCNGGLTSVTVSATGGTMFDTTAHFNYTVEIIGNQVVFELNSYSGEEFVRYESSDGFLQVTMVGGGSDGFYGAGALFIYFDPNNLPLELYSIPYEHEEDLIETLNKTIKNMEEFNSRSEYTGIGTFNQSFGSTIYTVTDANGCSATTSVYLTVPTTLDFSATFGSIACNGGSASVTVSANGGTNAYVGTGIFSQSVGTTVYTVIDGNYNCSSTLSVTLTEPAALVASASSGTIACNGGSTSVTISANGGTAAYFGTGTFSQSVGTTVYTVTDANNCSSTTSVTLTEPAALVVSASAGTIVCNGGSTSLTVSANGGTTAYSGTGTFTQSIGSTTYTVNDANGCSSTTSVTLTEPATLVASATSASIACNGESASVTVSANGGTTAYSGTGTFSQSVGTTTYTVTDAKGCSSTTSVTLTEPDSLVASALAGTIACNGGSASVTVSANGGNTDYSGTGTFTQFVGTTTYRVTDNRGCSSTTLVTLTQPTTLVAFASSGAIICNGGTTSVTVSANGGTGAYSGTGTFTRGSGTSVFTVSDANGCNATTSVTLTAPASLSISVSAGIISCFSGSASVTVSASGGTAPLSGEGSYTQSAGSQNYVVIDDLGCIASASVTLTEPSKVEISIAGSTDAGCSNNAGTATVAAVGGTPAYSYSWSSGQSSATAGGLSAGTYYATVTDSRGCTASALVAITQAISNPPIPSAISGALAACRNTTQVYSVQNIAGVTYNWTLPSGATGSSTGNTITVNNTSSFIGGQLCVSTVNNCGVSSSSCIPVTCVLAAPIRPSSIIGSGVVCGPAVAQYYVNPIPGATSYTWAVNGGLTIASGNGTNSVQLNIPANFSQGTIFVYATNCFGNSNTTSLTITGLAGAGAIVGPNINLCPGTSATYSVAPVANATGYTWTGTANMTLTSSGNTCTVNFGPSWSSGTLSVSVNSTCGTFTRSATLRGAPAQPGSITGQGSGVCNSTQVYSISPVASATSYSWSAPAGVTVSGTSTSATVIFPSGYTSNSAPICVTANNACGSSVARCFTVTTRPALPIVTGPATVCRTAESYTYTTTGSPTATSYTWTVTGGAALSASGLSATVNFISSLTGSQQVRCIANNACGASQTGTANVTVNACRSENQSMTIEGEEKLMVFPNPTDGRTTVSFTAEKKSDYSLTVTDLLGKAILFQTFSAAEGYNKTEINLTGMSHGVYLLTLRNETGSAQTIRLVVY